jgi:U3 small nucleolar RNA-associated protein 15
VLAFTVRYIARPRFAALLVGVAHKLLDIYGPVAGQSEVIDELFAKLQQQVSMECKDQQNLLRLTGQIDALLAAAEDDEYNFATN